MNSYYLSRRDVEEWKTQVKSRYLGKHVGYCDGLTIDGYKCGLMYGSLEVGLPCGRCGTILKPGKIHYAR
jgi:hypothetical protein